MSLGSSAEWLLLQQLGRLTLPHNAPAGRQAASAVGLTPPPLSLPANLGLPSKHPSESCSMWGCAEDLQREIAEGGVYRVTQLLPDKRALR